MKYVVVMHKEPGSDFGVSVPDLPGCVSAGSTADEALAMIQEAIELHLEGLIEDGGIPPRPTSLEALRADPAYADGVWAIVSIDDSTLRVEAKRINITLPARVSDAIDRYCKATGETRSGLLARGALAYIGRDAGSMPKGEPGYGQTRRLKKRAKDAASAPSKPFRKGA